MTTQPKKWRNWKAVLWVKPKRGDDPDYIELDLRAENFDHAVMRLYDQINIREFFTCDVVRLEQVPTKH